MQDTIDEAESALLNLIDSLLLMQEQVVGIKQAAYAEALVHQAEDLQHGLKKFKQLVGVTDIG